MSIFDTKTSRRTDVSVLVTGAAGVIGRRLVPVLSGRGHRVVASLRHRGAATMSAGVETVVGDLHEPDVRRAAAQALRSLSVPRAVVHLAANAAPGADGDASRRADQELTALLLDLAEAVRVERFMLASSALVYAPAAAGVLDEEAPTDRTGAYAQAKLAAEAATRDATNRTSTHCDVLRLANVYGPESPVGTVVGDLMAQVAAGSEQLRVRSQAPVRDFVFVDDVAEAVWRILESPPQRGCDIINVSSGRGTSIGELARIVARVAGLRAPGPDADSKAPADRRVLDNRRLYQRTGWKPRRSVESGIRTCLEPMSARGPA